VSELRGLLVLAVVGAAMFVMWYGIYVVVCALTSLID